MRTYTYIKVDSVLRMMDGLLGPGPLLRVHGDIAGASHHTVEKNIVPVLQKSKVSDGTSSSAIKGTTLVFNSSKNHFSCLIDSRSTYTDGNGVQHIYTDFCRKYRVFWKRIIVVYIDDVTIGQAVLNHLYKILPKDDAPIEAQLTVDQVANLAFRFHPKNASGNCDVYICSLSDDGNRRILRVQFGYAGRPNLKQVLDKCKGVLCAFGSGACAVQKASFIKCRAAADWDQKKTLLSMIETCSTIDCTGGHILEFDLAIDERGKKNFTKNKRRVWDCMKDYFSTWDHSKKVFVLYDKKLVDFAGFEKWMGQKFTNTDKRIKFSDVAKVSESELVVGCITFKNAAIVDKVLANGTLTSKILQSEPAFEVIFDKKIFYLVRPSESFLNVKVDVLEEYDSIPQEDLDKADDVASDDHKLNYLSD